MCLPGTIEAVREQTDREGVSRRALLAGGGAAAIAAAMPGTADAKRRRRRGHGHGGKGFGKVTDLTHTFRAGFPVYTGDEPTRRTLFNYNPDGFYSQEWTFGEHSGTHMDAPGHFVEGNRRVDELKPEELLAPAAVIDISSRAVSNPDAEVTPDDVRRYERRHGRIPRGAIVFMNSGWAAKVNDDLAYKGTVGTTYHFPGFGIEAVEFLLTRRSIQGIGVDTLSLDPGNSTTFAVHTGLLGTNVHYGLENVANLSALRPRGALVSVGVVPWEEGSGGPCRLLAYG
jgi:kynurenine formamidase